MPDREKVIRDLRYLKSFGRVSNNPQITEIAEYAIELLKEQEETINDLAETIRQLNQHIKDLSEYMTPYGKVKDVKAVEELLKEQEAVEPFHKCIGNSHTLIEDSGFLYCPYCGKPIVDTEGR